jgi:hypothetical protein
MILMSTQKNRFHQNELKVQSLIGRLQDVFESIHMVFYSEARTPHSIEEYILNYHKKLN